MFAQVSPPSVLRQMPLSGPPLLICQKLRCASQIARRECVGWRRCEIDRAGLFADEQHLLPGRAAVDALEDAALLVRAEGVTERRDPDDVGIVGMDADLADVAGVFESDVGPARPASVLL